VPFDTVLWKGDRYIPAWELSGLLWLRRFHADLLAPATAAALQDGLARMCRGQVAEFARGKRVHNIPCWAAAALWYAGSVFGEPSWQAAARDYLARVGAECTPDGYWTEHTGPTTLYNLVYTHAFGLHLWDGGERFDAAHRPEPVEGFPAAEVLRRAGAFHSRFVYPDGTLVSIIDGRVLYHGGHLQDLGLAGLLQAESAAAYVETLAASRCPFGPVSGNGVTFMPQVYRMLREGVRVAAPGAAGRVPLGERVAMHSAGAFTAALSGLLGSVENRWGYDRLQHLEVHHREAGVLLGGGLSRGPELAFLAGDGGHLATGSRLEAGGRALRLAYPWGEARIEVEPLAGGLAVSLEARAGKGELTMLLPVLAGWFEGAPEAGAKVAGLRGKGAAIRVEPEATLRFPLKPWFPYHPEGESSAGMWRWGLAWQGRGSLKARLRFEG
jgi:hypothetical protein